MARFKNKRSYYVALDVGNETISIQNPEPKQMRGILYR